MVRRMKHQVKPSVAGAPAAAPTMPTPPVPVDSPVRASSSSISSVAVAMAAFNDPTTPATPITPITPMKRLSTTNTRHGSNSKSSNAAAAQPQPQPTKESTPILKAPRPIRRVNPKAAPVPAKKKELCTVDEEEENTPEPGTSADADENLGRGKRKRTLSTSSSVRSDSTARSTPATKKITTAGGRKKRVATVGLNEELDPKKFLMSDLIVWKPKTENPMRKKRLSEKKAAAALEAEAAAANALEAPESKANALRRKNAPEVRPNVTTAAPAAAATTGRAARGPRVKINAQGEMVIDEDSLVMIDKPEDNQWETVNDDLREKKLTSMSFRKNYSRATAWTHSETDLFYEVLAATGTDFYLMHDFIPTRNRSELKKKFNREERVDPERVNETLRNPVLLEVDSLRERISIYEQRITDEEDEKAAEKERKAAAAAARKAKKAKKAKRKKHRRDSSEEDEEEEEDENDEEEEQVEDEEGEEESGEEQGDK